MTISLAITPCSAALHGISAKDLTYITEQYPPYNYEKDGKLQGLSVEILEKVWEKMNVSLNSSVIELLPWSEGYNKTLKENNTVLFATGRLPEREQLFKWAGPIAPGKYVLLARSDKNIRIVAPEDLKKIKIGAIVNDMAVQLLLDKGVKKEDLVLETTSKPIIEMLKNGSIDAWAYDDLTGIWELRESGENASSYGAVYELGIAEGYLAFNKGVPDSLVQSFQQALYHVKNDKGKDGTSEYEKILYKYLPVSYSAGNITDSQVIGLVNLIAEEIETNATDTIAKINAGKDPYKNKSNPALYAFVFDTDVNVVANADNPQLVGMNFRGKGDVSGKRFRDEIVAGALKNGTGWEDYIFTSPVEDGLFYKTAYYKLVKGSDGKNYIVCSGKYKSK